MPRKKKESVFICPSCGTVVKEPERTWSLVSPIPDKYGRVTITIMGSFRCPNCGYTWKGVLKKMKSGGEEKGEEEETKPEPGEVIEIDISDLDSVEEEPPDL
ncbi:MAG: chromatin protein Cren7 [Caldisphaeraceae archaeon]|nr:chromatin protein Cren7 [Caldisphaeraceae archaeon]MEB3797589.1 chromatin protein Cren7 [Caldisphaeraceae archaeon]